MSDPHSPRPETAEGSDSPRTKAGVELYYWFRGHDEVTGNRLDTETSRLIRAIEDEAAGTVSRNVLLGVAEARAIRSAGTPPATERRPVHVHDYGAAQIPCSQDCLAATPPEPVGGREALRTLLGLCYGAIDGDYGNLTEDQHRAIRVALQASPPTGVSGALRADVPDWMLSDIKARDAQTEPTPVRALPLGESGTKYDHARRQTSTYHLDSPDVAMGDRHVLLHGWTGPRPVDPQPAMGVPDAREQADSEPQQSEPPADAG